jgi:CheY-like chemotaxis protein
MQKHDMTVTVRVPEEEVTLREHQKIILFQSVRELLINASKHAGTGHATVRLERCDEQLQIEVRDDGAGFDLAAAAAAAADLPTGGMSSKFGLFSIQERMRSLGGSFTLHSTPGQGTTAMLSLPLRDDVSGTRKDELSKTSVGKGVEVISEVASRLTPDATRIIRVLLVDDHAMVRQGLRSVLNAYDDLQVVGEAQDGEEAIKLVEELRPRVVVMDINMPRMNGIDATTYITTHWPKTTVIGISVNAEDDNSTAMRRAGAATVLPKESAVDQLHDAIIQAVSISAETSTFSS